MAKKEPTLGEFMTFIKRQFGLQQQLLEKTAEDVRDLRQGQMSHDRRLDEVEQAMRGVLRAVDRDAVKVVDHERRIHRLEFRTK